MELLSYLKSFFKNPTINEPYTPLPWKDFVVLLVLVLITIIPYSFFLEFLGIDQFDHKLLDLLKKNKWLFAFLGVFLAPLIEEPIFRLHLDLKKSSLWWSLGLSILVISELWYPAALLMIYLILLLIMVYRGVQPNRKYVIFISAALFGLVHMINYTGFDFGKYYYWVPFLVAIQFFLGLILSYIRLKNGIKWAIIFHGTYNAILVIPAVYFLDPSNL